MWSSLRDPWSCQ
jgi:hypothetical protein